ncbi:hypothetical protein ACJOV8_014335 [Formosa sp. 3Alg 14/1]
MGKLVTVRTRDMSEPIKDTLVTNSIPFEMPGANFAVYDYKYKT